MVSGTLQRYDKLLTLLTDDYELATAILACAITENDQVGGRLYAPAHPLFVLDQLRPTHCLRAIDSRTYDGRRL